MGKSDTLTKEKVFAFASKFRHANLATVSVTNGPEAATVGFVMTPELEIVFDTTTESRKYRNLRQNNRIAFVIGGLDDEVTLQYEGEVEILAGDALTYWKPEYFEKFPDGHEREFLPDIAYILVRPKWARMSDFGQEPPVVEEMSF
ncbi:MAG: pyridoxamine 5'-phosphate oxidase family protein [Candidatus Zixiibacteriota bacterium]